MTGSIEVELPRYTIAPFDRDQDQYWELSADCQEGTAEERHLLDGGDRVESTLSMVEEGRVTGYLRGGAWRAFHWKKLIVGRKLYRIQYEDELREPPAEVNFEDLVHFLLDWGALPDSMGWEKLRSGGLWTPAGTVLLRKTNGDEDGADESKRHRGIDWVLRTSMPDESDGVLSLSIRWSIEANARSVAEIRGAASLPPGWGRLNQPALLEPSDERKEKKKDLPGRIEELKAQHKYSMDSSSFRFRTEDNHIQRLLWEDKNVETGFVSEPFRHYEQSSAGLWFTCAASALLSHKQSTSGGLWAFEMPTAIKSFVRKDSIPCGVMVLLGVLPNSDAPQWSTAKDNENEGHAFATQSHQAFMARLAAERLEKTMPPEQASIHRMNREAAERQQTHNNMMARMAARHEREEKMIKEAIASPRMCVRKASESCLRWLIERGEVGNEWTVEQLAEAVLYLIVVDLQNQRQSEKDEAEGAEAMRIVRLLDEWTSWAAAGGMKKQEYHMLEGDKNKTAFCFAIALVAVVTDAVNSNDAGMGKAGAEILECLRLWRTVRLG